MDSPISPVRSLSCLQHAIHFRYLTASIPLFKASTFLLNPEISLADCALAPILWRLDALGVALPRGGSVIADYGNRIFRSQGFARSLTQHERELRALPE